MLKKIATLTTVLLLIALQSCKENEESKPVVGLSAETLVFTAEKSVRDIQISCAAEWRLSVDQGWCSVLGAEVTNQPCDGKVLRIGVEENNSLRGREAKITITPAGGVVKVFTVSQAAAGELAPALKSFRFRVAANAGKLQQDITLKIDKSQVAARTSYVLEDKVLVPEFEYEGWKVSAAGQEIVSGQTEVDFSGPVALTIESRDGRKSEYTVRLMSLNGLPVVYIDTKGVPIVSKEEYVAATIRIVDNNGQRPSTIFTEAVEVKGRGNSTWLMPKKPYRLKFDKKQGLLGRPKDKSWVLLANYMDDDCGMRNATAYSIGHQSCMEFTPTVQFVDLFLNGAYNGTYELCEHMKISEDRVNVTDEGFLIEAEQRDNEAETGDVYFWANTADPKVDVRFCIKDPEVAKDTPQYNEIKDYVNQAQAALYGSDSKDPERGYAKYLNVDTYVDWYVISEITKTNDAALYTSCYMNKAPGGKLNMGPMWDYDICIGNSKWNGQGPEGYWNRHSPWFSRLLQDPAFVQKVKTRISYFKANLPAILARMDENAEYAGLSVVEDNRLWENIRPKSTADDVVRGVFMQDVGNMKTWLTTRLDWLDRASFTD